MFSSDHINATFQQYQQPMGHQMTPYVYSQGTPYSHHMTDPYFQGAADKIGGVAAGAIGISGVSGMVGGAAMFGAMGAGLKGAWGGLTTTSSGAGRWGAFNQATGFMNKAKVAGGGLGRAAMMGVASALPLYAAMKGVEYVGENIYAGAQFQQDVNRISGRYMRFQNQSSGLMGFGASRQQKMGIGDMLTQMGQDDTLRSKEELTRVMDKLGQRNFFQDATSVDNFKKKFKESVDTLKHMAKTFGSTIEEAIPLLESMKHSGLYTSSAQRAMGTRIRLSGMNMQEATGAMQYGAQVSRATGGDMQSGAMGAFSFQNMLNYAQSNLSQKESSRVTKLMSEITGGKTGQEARTETMQRMMGATESFLHGPLGRMALAGLVNKDFTGLDQSKVEQLQEGKLSLSQLTNLGLSNTASMKNKARFVNREGDLRGAFLKQGGPMLMASLIRSTMTSGILQGSKDEDIQEIIMKRFGFGDRRMAQLATTLTRNLPEMRAGMNRNALRQASHLAEQQDRSEIYSFGAVSKRVRQSIGNAMSRPFQDFGRSVYQGVGDMARNFFRPSGMATVGLDGDTAKRLRGGDMSVLEDMDFNMTRSSDIQKKASGMWGRFAEWMAGKDRSEDAGSFMGNAFTKEQLHSFGMHEKKVWQLQASDIIMHRIDKHGKVIQKTGRDSADQMVRVTNVRNFDRLVSMEQRRASGEAAVDVMNKTIGGDKALKQSMKMITNQIRDKIIMDPSMHKKFKAASAAEKKRMLREMVREQEGKDPNVRGLIGKRAVNSGDGYAGIDNAIDDLVATADASLKSRGIDLGMSYGSGGTDTSLVDSAKKVKALKSSALTKMGESIQYQEYGAGVWDEGVRSRLLFDTASKGVLSKDTEVSRAVMKQLTGQKMSDEDKNILSVLKTVKGGEGAKIGKTSLDSAEVSNLQELLERVKPVSDAERGNRAKAYKDWERSFSLEKVVGVQGQIKSFGDLGFNEISKMGGIAQGSLKSMFLRMQHGMKTKGDMREALSGGLLKDVIGDVSKLQGADRDNYIASLGQSGEVGKAISASLRTYFSKAGKDGKGGNLQDAMKVLLGRLFSEGKTAVSDKGATMENVTAVWSDYVKANQQFIQAVAVVLKDKDLSKVAAGMKAKTRTGTGGK